MSEKLKAATEEQAFELDLSDAATTVKVMFRYERIDGAPLGSIDGGSIRAFAGLLQTVGVCLQQGQNAAEIVQVCRQAQEAFRAMVAAHKGDAKAN